MSNQTTNGSIVYRVAETGTSASQGYPNDIFNWTVPVEVEAPEGGITEKKQRRADIYLIFASLDGKAFGNLQNRVRDMHPQAWSLFKAYCEGNVLDTETGEVKELHLGSLLKTRGNSYRGVKIDGKQESQERRIFFGITKQECTDNHDLALIEEVVIKLQGFVLALPEEIAKNLVIALSYPQSYGSPWAKVKAIYDEHLSGLPCTFIAQVAANRAPRPARAREDELIGEGTPLVVAAASASVSATSQADPYLPDYEDSLDSDPEFAESPVIMAAEAKEKRTELSDEEALTDVQERYDAYEAALYKATGKSR